MNHEQILAYDFSDDSLPPREVRNELDMHDNAMRDARDTLALYDACYGTRYWEQMQAMAARATESDGDSSQHIVEVNRLKPMVEAYLNAMFPKGITPKLSRGATGRGDPEKAQLALGEWLRRERNIDRITLAMRQALLFPGAGSKVWHTSDDGDPIDRVEMRVLPWWEVVLDRDCTDWKEQRFRGHVGWYSRDEIAEKYDVPGIQGRRRALFLEDKDGDEKASAPSSSEKKADGDQFVRVLELCNLTDHITVDGQRYKGRFEVYVLGQAGTMSHKPVFMGPLPFESPSGKGEPHIEALILDHEPAYPLRGLPYVRALMPQQHEINYNRAYLSEAADRDARIWAMHGGVLNQEEQDKLREGKDKTVLRLNEKSVDRSKPVQHYLAPLNKDPISPNVTETLDRADMDLRMVAAAAANPNTQGVLTRATAAEVQRAGWYTDSEFGRKSFEKDRWLGRVLMLVLQALISAMEDAGNSLGADQDEPDVEPGLVDDPLADDAEESADEARADAAAANDARAEDEAEDEAEVPDDPMAAYRARKKAPVAKDEGEDGADSVLDALLDAAGVGNPGAEPDAPAREPTRLFVRRMGDDDEVVEVTVEDLSGDFIIGFVDSGRSPSDDSTTQEFLASPLADKYEELIGRAFKGGADGMLAQRRAEAMAEQFKLPPQMAPDSLLSAMRSAEDEGADEPPATPQAPPQAPPEAAPPPQAGPPPPQAPQAAPAPPQAPPAGAPALTPEQGQQLLSLPPEQAIQIIAEQLGLPEQAQQIASLPPEAQAEAIQIVVQNLLQEA